MTSQEIKEHIFGTIVPSIDNLESDLTVLRLDYEKRQSEIQLRIAKLRSEWANLIKNLP